MIERYSLSPLKELWTEEAKYQRWLRVELAVVKAFEHFGEAPVGTCDLMLKGAVVDVQKIMDIESVVDHDVIAFIKCVTENMGDEARYFHKGLTSSDIGDTALSMAIKQAGEYIAVEFEKYLAALRKLASIHRNTVTVGRTHGIHAEPTSFGLKVLTFLAEGERNLARLGRAIEGISCGKLSGAVGNYANISPEVESFALSELGLEPCKVSTQIVPRDLHAEFLSSLALLGAGIERFALEIRHLQKTEVLEAQEPFKKGQRGSSAMPHKKNPILCERLSGMARMLRSYAVAGYEDILLWHERDISHSSVERVFMPDATLTAYYMAKKAAYLAENLVVYPERMEENLEASYNLVYSQRVMLSLVERGISREESYKIVQENALKSWETRVNFKKLLKEDLRITGRITVDEIDELFDPSYYLKNVSSIYRRFNLE